MGGGNVKSFSTNDDGDVIVNGSIEMVTDNELLRQKVQRVLGTNKGEWSYDTEEGIDFSVVLRKNPNEDEIRATIEEALMRIDETFVITSFGLTMDGRKATVCFEAVNADGVKVMEGYTYG